MYLDIKIMSGGYFYRPGSLDVKRYAAGMAPVGEIRPNGPDGLDDAGPARAAGRDEPAGPVRDEVDDLVARWQAERPDLDVSPLQVLSRLSRLARHLDRARRAAFAAHGLEPWEFDVLSALRRQGPPYQLSPGALLHATLVTSGTMTNRIDRLAAAGLVSRRRDEQDKRDVVVALTPRGQAAADAALAGLLERERELLTGLGPEQQAELAGLLRILLAPFDAHPPQ
jgi:DNA-binding MarR family transcriptional regulator